MFPIACSFSFLFFLKLLLLLLLLLLLSLSLSSFFPFFRKLIFFSFVLVLRTPDGKIFEPNGPVEDCAYDHCINLVRSWEVANDVFLSWGVYLGLWLDTILHIYVISFSILPLFVQGREILRKVANFKNRVSRALSRLPTIILVRFPGSFFLFLLFVFVPISLSLVYFSKKILDSFSLSFSSYFDWIKLQSFLGNDCVLRNSIFFGQ